jgi:tetrapyrrole methylase family protein/MazG family protein
VTPRVTVVGLGPGGADLLTPRARAALDAGRVLVRTARHPAVEELRAAGVAFEPLDAVYDAAPDLDAAYATIVERVVGAARADGAAVYAVPGSPGVAERAVAMLRERAEAGEITVEVVPGLSFADLAWARLGVDPMATGARVVDGRDLGRAAGFGGALLIAQCDTRLVLSDVKLALLEVADPATEVVVLQRLGLPDESVDRMPLADLDRTVDPDHLTSVYVHTGEASIAGETARLVALAERLRGPGGCPWDAEQTHRSLVRYLLEEAYETVETLEALPMAAPAGEPDLDAYARLEDELGDVLFQVVFHSILAAEAGAFTFADVARGIHDKLVRRHPHVFGAVEVAGSDEVLANWEVIKQEEKGTESIVDGISPALPSLLYALKLFRKAATVGLAAADRDAAVADLEVAIARLRDTTPADDDVAVGDLLAAAVAVARTEGVDAESALRGWAGRFRDRFRATEALAEAEGRALRGLEPAAARDLWRRADPSD